MEGAGKGAVWSLCSIEDIQAQLSVRKILLAEGKNAHLVCKSFIAAIERKNAVLIRAYMINKMQTSCCVCWDKLSVSGVVDIFLHHRLDDERLHRICLSFCLPCCFFSPSADHAAQENCVLMKTSSGGWRWCVWTGSPNGRLLVWSPGAAAFSFTMHHLPADRR